MTILVNRPISDHFSRHQENADVDKFMWRHDKNKYFQFQIKFRCEASIMCIINLNGYTV